MIDAAFSAVIKKGILKLFTLVAGVSTKPGLISFIFTSFGKSTLRTLKIKVTKDAFLNSPDLQEYAMIQNLNYNKNKLQKYIDQFEGQEINGILITESGILAAAHLAGAGSVRKFFRNGKEFKDGFGTSMTSYMTEFGGYKLNL